MSTFTLRSSIADCNTASVDGDPGTPLSNASRSVLKVVCEDSSIPGTLLSNVGFAAGRTISDVNLIDDGSSVALTNVSFAEVSNGFGGTQTEISITPTSTLTLGSNFYLEVAAGVFEAPGGAGGAFTNVDTNIGGIVNNFLCSTKLPITN